MIHTASADPVKNYYDALEKLHINIRTYSPFSFLAYKSLIPNEDDDFIGLAYKISYFVTFRFFIQLGIEFVSPLCSIIPFVPLVLDFLWISYHSMDQLAFPPLTAILCLSVNTFVIHYLNQLPQFW